MEKNRGIVALKEIDLEKTDNSIIDIQKEIDILKECESIYVIRFFGVFLAKYHLCFVMEYMEFGSLHDYILIRKLPENFIATVLQQILAGLSFLHKNRIIHRDIKCANILINSKGDLKLGDFGVAVSIERHSSTSTFAGTPYWMAPEVIQEMSYTEKCDIWSLGITVIEMATGSTPFSSIPPMQALRRIAEHEPPVLKGDFSTHLKDCVSRCLVKEPSNRPSASSLLSHPFLKCAKKKEAFIEYLQEIKSTRIKKSTQNEEIEFSDFSYQGQTLPDDSNIFVFPPFPNEKPPEDYLSAISKAIMNLSKSNEYQKINDSLFRLGGLFLQCDILCPGFSEEFCQKLKDQFPKSSEC